MDPSAKVRTSTGHQRGLLVATSADLNWPPPGTFSWPWTRSAKRAGGLWRSWPRVPHQVDELRAPGPLLPTFAGCPGRARQQHQDHPSPRARRDPSSTAVPFTRAPPPAAHRNLTAGLHLAGAGAIHPGASTSGPSSAPPPPGRPQARSGARAAAAEPCSTTGEATLHPARRPVEWPRSSATATRRITVEPDAIRGRCVPVRATQ